MRSPRRPLRVLVPAIAVAVLVGCVGTAVPHGSETTVSSASSPTVDVLASGLEVPWSITDHDGSTLVSERDSARILEIGGDGTLREVATIEGVTPGGEGGLLGIVAHEDHLFVYSTAGAQNRVQRFPLIGEPGALDLGEPDGILDGIPAARTHNGGRIAIGPDGMLYVTTGDAGDGASAQDPGSLSGKILRLTPDGEIPADNPSSGSPVYSLGHRNPQGLAWDESGTMYASEFGQNTWDELNVVEPGGNYGWPEVEGIAGDDRYVDPVQQWDPADASPSGIAVSGGSIWIANLRGERLRDVPLDDLGTSREHLVGEHGRLRDVSVDPDGTLRILTNSTDGRGDPGPDGDLMLRVEVD